MAQTLSNFDAALRYNYLPVVREQLNNSTYLLSKIQRNTDDVSGSRWQMTVHYQRTAGVGARADRGALPTAGNQAFLSPYGTCKYNYARIDVSGPTIAASRDNEGAITRALTQEMKGALTDFKKDVNYQLFNDGTAVRCLVNGDPGTGTTLTVDTPGTQYLSAGMLIDVVDASSGAVEDEDVVISSVDSNTQVTVSAALDAGIEDNSKVVRADTTDGAGTGYEMMGLKGIADDATYASTLHGLARASYAWWNCATHDDDDNAGTNRDLTTDLMQASVSAVEKLGGKTDLILCRYEERDAYAAELVADKRFVNTMDLDGGWKALEFNGIPILADPDCPPNTMFFVDTSHLFLMQMGDVDWMDKDGSILAKVSGYDSYEAVLFWYADLATDRPRAHSFLRDVQ